MKSLFRAAAVGALILCAGAASAQTQAAKISTVPATAAPPPAAFADTLFHATTLNLSAYGETRTTPDMATIQLGVTTEAPTAGEALKANAAKMTQVITALKKGGVAAKDLQTSGLNLNPQYVYEQNLPPKLTGYQVSNQVTVIVRDLSKLGQTVDVTVGAGANTVGGVSFGLQDSQAAEDSARLAAVKALQAKADLYAKATGYRIARLVSLGEGGGYAPAPPMPVFAMAKRAESDSTPTEAGELKVRIDVSATYELVR